ncbi:MAG TPA: polysaccharide deacetylase family protein [Verrucomicrobiales bacterium]|nr:polysaccharide deacetylase family protein [Verrucomicrobiales bacterium]
MNRRHFLCLAAPAAVSLLPSCKSTKPAPVSQRPGPALPSPGPVPGAIGYNPGPVPRSLPPGIRHRWSSAQVRGPFAAMTFDDGPHPVNTPRVLDMLRSWGIKATFFLIGQNAARYPGLVRRIVAEGHEVGNHSWSHPALGPMPDAAVRDQLRRTHDAITSACGVAPLVFRPPYGSITAAQQDWIAREFGYPTILWSVDPNDWKDRNSSIVSSRILKSAHAGSIILAHDIHPTTVNAMPATLPALTRRGLKFLTVSQIILAEASAGAVPG